MAKRPKVYVLCEVEEDYLEVFNNLKVIGVFMTRKAAATEAKKRKLADFTILPHVVRI